eukprot:scaffold201478_cov31-Tisochrysis_lutea.AAC.3
MQPCDVAIGKECDGNDAGRGFDCLWMVLESAPRREAVRTRLLLGPHAVTASIAPHGKRGGHEQLHRQVVAVRQREGSHGAFPHTKVHAGWAIASAPALDSQPSDAGQTKMS